MFELATRNKLRFTSPQGQISVEDLWDLPLTSTTGRANLDEIAIGLYTELSNNKNISFVSEATKNDTILQTKFEIVKHIIGVRKMENEAASLARTNREKKQQLLALIAQKENEQLAGTSLDELRKMAESM